MNSESQIIRTEYSDLMKKSYIDYAMSVIISRALPDVRDGLKPVQRRTLYDMYELGIRYDKPYRKCARIVGDTMGKYHPHGDSSIYESLVVMAQEFKKGMVLVDGHGNFGSIEGDGAAAMRYTEARLTKFTQEVCLADLDKDVVDFGPNFDETEKEPLVLPMRVPNLLVNGAEGIAVGMATSIPPHNLGEVIDAVKAYIKNDSITTKQLMKYIKGPDFPTGGIVVNKDDLINIYETGQGKIKVRGKVETEELKGGKKNICIGLLAHVDAGKTTLSEEMLHRTGVLEQAGRVDKGNAFLDTYELEKPIILVPILAPIAAAYGFDPVHFGVVMIFNLAVGLCTPPVGSALFVGCAIGKTPIERTAKNMMPLYLTMVIVLMLVTYIPDVSLLLPRLLMGYGA